MKGIGQSVLTILTIPAFTGLAPIATVTQALEEVTGAKAGDRIKGQLGVSLLARRMKARRGTTGSQKTVNKCRDRLSATATS
jgi:hypothetical protein